MEKLAQLSIESNFTSLDWGIVAAYLAASVVIGIVANRFVTDMADYVVAGRGVRTALGIATLTGTELGLVTVMYNAQKGFSGGFAAFHIGLIAGVVTLFIGLSGFIIGTLRRHEVLTISEFYGRRFGPRTRILGGAVLAAAGILNMGLFLNAGAKFILGITGLHNEYALGAVMLVLLVLVLFYTILGGMVSVILTDYVQFVVLAVGLVLTTLLAINRLGWQPIFDTMLDARGAKAYNPFDADSSFGAEYVIWTLFSAGVVGCALWPTSVARALACDSEKTVKRQFTLASFSYATRMIVPCFWGICAFVFVSQIPSLSEVFFPDGIEAGADPAFSLYAMPIFLGRILPVGLIGLITAAMIAAFMSTHDSYFLCWSSVITNDVIVPLFEMRGQTLSQQSQVRISRLLILITGVLIYTISYLYPLGQDLWDYMAISGAIYFTGAFAVLLGGLYWPRASSTGAVLALLFGSTAALGLETVQRVLIVDLLGLSEKILELLTVARVGIASVLLALIAMVAGSLLFPDRPRRTESTA